jgi:uncharacterized protein YkwD
MPLRLAHHVPRVLLVAIVAGLTVWISRPMPAAASIESSTASTILASINRDRQSLGLVALRTDTRLAALAAHRAQWMASTNDMSHDSYGGAVFDAVAMVGVNAYSSAEAVGATTATPGPDAANYLYGMWRGSPEHWNFMMSGTFNYIGVGVAYGSGQTWSSLVFAEAPDSSRPVITLTGAGRSGNSVFWTWTGRDAQLQTHTAGLRDYDVEYRVDRGSWRILMSHTTSTQLILKNRLAGHVYSVRVRDRDRRNNLSPWSSIRAVRV